jgi:hypothetical protein
LTIISPFFAFRVDIWDDTGDSIVEHVAGVDDFEVAEATYRAAVARWPAARISAQAAGWRVQWRSGAAQARQRTIVVTDENLHAAFLFNPAVE